MKWLALPKDNLYTYYVANEESPRDRLFWLVDSSGTFVENVVNSISKADLRSNGVDVLTVGECPVLRIAWVWLGCHDRHGQVLVAVSQLQCTLLDGSKIQLDLVAN